MSGLKQWALHVIEKWCNEVGLSVNPNKTELVVFTMRRKLSGFFEPHFFWVTLSCCRSVKLPRGNPGFSADLEAACGC